MNLLILALAPVLLLLSYIYFRDKYEKEPLGMILKGFSAGVVLIFPVGFTEEWLMQLFVLTERISQAAYTGFVVAGFTEELFKFLAVYFIFFGSRHFNERYDGIVYAVSVSLGFAAAENVYYVFEHGTQTGLIRAFTAVPAHAFMGVAMGFYLGLARFIRNRKGINLMKALMVPWMLHGLYDFILLSQHPALLFFFIPLMVFMLFLANYELKRHLRNSAFNPSSDAFAERPDGIRFPYNDYNLKDDGNNG